MEEKKFSGEANNLVKFILEKIADEYPAYDISSPYFIIGMLNFDGAIANGFLTKYLMSGQIEEINERCYEYLSKNSKALPDGNDGKQYKSHIIKEAVAYYGDDAVIDTMMLLDFLLLKDEFASKLLKTYGITTSRVKRDNAQEKAAKAEAPKKHEKKGKPISEIRQPMAMAKRNDNSEVERFLVNLNSLATQGKIDANVGNKKKYEDIIRVMLKKKNNNIILVGENGIGKTCMVRHLANMLVRGDVPKLFSEKVLMEVNYTTLISGMMFKGAYESRVKAIVEDAKRRGNYIFFIDDIDLLYENARYGENDIELLLKAVLDEDRILFITTCSTSGYSKLNLSHGNVTGKLQKVVIEEPDEAQALGILKETKGKYEDFHNVKYTESALKNCIHMCRRYFSERKLPNVAIDMLDEIGADFSMKEQDSKEISELLLKLLSVLKKKEECSNAPTKNYEEIDELTKKEIKLKSMISLAKKAQEMNKPTKTIDEKTVSKFISEKTGIPLSQLKHEEKAKLKNINEILKSVVIGQDEAVDEVCKVIKRQRMGLSNPNKPSVLMFTGGTGTGKTYLAKKLAEKIFGNEKYLVRFDMSEYSDKMSSSKLIGASAGYIGYENGGLLTEAIKKNKYCVLLLDECEKADDSVFNIFLQVFDDGRLTDNKGTLVDFRNVIIILTSNTGAQEVSERGKAIGFGSSKDDGNSLEKGIYEKAIKRKFKPEFINRIDKVVFFKKLSKENLKEIIKIEIGKVSDKLEGIGYSLDKDAYEPLVEKIIGNISDKAEYGARPILREIQNLLEDKITDLLIDNDYKKGHTFKYAEISTE